MSPKKEQHYDDFKYAGYVRRIWWPQQHKPVFRDIQELGAVIYEQYCAKQIATMPWIETTRARVDRIVQRAKDKQEKQGVNERDWRLLDSDIFSAFEWKVEW